MTALAYFDCNATTPIEPVVFDEVLRFMQEEFGNAGSRTHEYGARAKQAVNKARKQIADVVDAQPDEVYFTSGATESNNLAILGLVPFANQTDRRHIISTQIEHKAVLEPLEYLAANGFEVDLVSPNMSGRIDPDDLTSRLRSDTLLVSIMQANNETGTVQPVNEIAAVLASHDAFFHVDAAQGFGKEIIPLANKRIDLTSISGHKIYAPKGIGALVARRRGYDRVPLRPLMFGGGQERNLRPGTLPVQLIVGLGMAAELAAQNILDRHRRNSEIRKHVVDALMPFSPIFNGDLEQCLVNTLNFSLEGIDSEALMVALKSILAFSNGSACTSQSYSPSHVLKAMGLKDAAIRSAVRFSWSHLTTEPNWIEVQHVIASLTAKPSLQRSMQM